MTQTLMAEVEVEAPLREVYNQWTQFEEFPEFMQGVESVEQIDDVLTHWVVRVGGLQREFDAAIVDQVPDDHVAWASVDERVLAGRVAFTPLDADHTLVSLEMAWDPEGALERAGAAIGLDERRAELDLHRFKEFIEGRQQETGAWRGEIHDAMRDDDAATGAVPLGEAPGWPTPGRRSTYLSPDAVGGEPFEATPAATEEE